ncbi:hypothetical protein AB4342_19900, partial [Vibrio breoganii]
MFYCTPDNFGGGGGGGPTPFSTSRDVSFNSCPSGWTANGSQCTKTTTSTIGADKYCSAGYTLSGSQ